MKYNVKRLIRFLISGASAASTEYAVFILLYITVGNGMLVVCQTISFICGFIVSYTLNRNWVFKSDNKKKDELIRYAVLALINLILSNIIIWLLTYRFHTIFWIAKFIVMALIATWNYVIFQKIIFNNRD